MESLKLIARSVLALVLISLGVFALTHLIDSIYDFRLLFAAAAGAFLYKPVESLFNKIKYLQ